MSSQRNFLFFIFLLVSFLIWQSWEDENTKLSNEVLIKKGTGVFNNFDKKNTDHSNFKIIKIKSDVLELYVNLYGGDIDSANLLNYSIELFSNKPFNLLQSNKDFIYNVQSGYIGLDGPDSYNYNKGKRPIYLSNKQEYILKNTENKLIVPLIYIGLNGVIYKKIYTLKRGKYDVSLEYIVENNTKKPLSISFFGQLKQSIKLPKNFHSENFMNTYRGAAYSSDKINYKKYSFKKISNENLNVVTNCGWIAMLQQYFAVSWIPFCTKNIFYTFKTNDDIAIIGYKTFPFLVKKKSTFSYFSKLWIGPELQSEMEHIAPYLNLTVDYGWLWFISQPLFKLLEFIHRFIGNWGFSIIIITFIVRGIMYPLTKAQYVSMAKMRFLQPKIIFIKERYKNDKQKMSKEIMELYKKEKVNPLGGCLPLLIQMPIFLALYYMLVSSIELRHAPFLLWIQDLSAKDPYYILPFIMGVMMFFFQKFSPSNNADLKQQKIFMYMPIIFILFFLWFPSGLVLYYIISNLVTFIQQYIIYNGLKKRGLYNYTDTKE